MPNYLSDPIVVNLVNAVSSSMKASASPETIHHLVSDAWPSVKNKFHPSDNAPNNDHFMKFHGFVMGVAQSNVSVHSSTTHVPGNVPGNNHNITPTSTTLPHFSIYDQNAIMNHLGNLATSTAAATATGMVLHALGHPNPTPNYGFPAMVNPSFPIGYFPNMMGQTAPYLPSHIPPSSRVRTHHRSARQVVGDVRPSFPVVNHDRQAAPVPARTIPVSVETIAPTPTQDQTNDFSDISSFSSRVSSAVARSGPAQSSRGHRYRISLLHSLDVNIPQALHSPSQIFQLAVSEFSSRFQCVENPHAKLEKKRSGKNTNTLQKFVCSCYKVLPPHATPPKVFELRIRIRNGHGGFDILFPASRMDETALHFRSRLTGLRTAVPSNVIDHIQLGLSSEPTFSVAEVLQSLLCSSQESVQQWVGNAVLHDQRQKDDLFRQIEALCRQAERRHANAIPDHLGAAEAIDDITGQNSFNSILQVERYTRANSIQNTFRLVNVYSSDLPRFTSLDHFIEFWKFTGPHQLLTLPLTPPGDSQPHSPMVVARLAATIAFTSPSHLYCLYRGSSSIVTDEDKIWQNILLCDGKFKLYRSGNPVLLTFGRQCLRTNADGKAVRSFLPLFHAMAPSENQHSVSAALLAFKKCALSTTGVHYKPRSSITDMSKGLLAGVKQAFPNCTRTIDREHLRAGPSRLWSNHISSRSLQKRLVHHLDWITHATNDKHSANLVNRAVKQWREMELNGFADFYLTHVFETEKSNCHVNVLPGIGSVPETSGLERYFLALKGSEKLSQIGILHRNVSLSTFVSTGIPKILRLDGGIHTKLDYGAKQPLHHWPVQDSTLACALLYDSEDRIRLGVISSSSPRWSNLGGFLYNRPFALGRPIGRAEVDKYFEAIGRTSTAADIAGSSIGLVEYCKNTSKCHVMTVREWKELMTHPILSQLYEPPCHPGDDPSNLFSCLDYLSDDKYICMCPMFRSELACPASLHANNKAGKLSPTLETRAHALYSGAAHNANPTRRRRRPAGTERPGSQVYTMYSMPHQYRDATAPFICLLSRREMEKLVRVRGLPGYANNNKTKIQKIAVILSGTHYEKRLVSQSVNPQETSRTAARARTSLERNLGTAWGEEDNAAFFNPYQPALPTAGDAVHTGVDAQHSPDCRGFWLEVPPYQTVHDVWILGYGLALRHVVSSTKKDALVFSQEWLTSSRFTRWACQLYDHVRRCARNQLHERISRFCSGTTPLEPSLVDHRWAVSSGSMEERLGVIDMAVETIVALLVNTHIPNVQELEDEERGQRVAALIKLGTSVDLLVVRLHIAIDGDGDPSIEDECPWVFHVLDSSKIDYNHGASRLRGRSLHFVIQGAVSLEEYLQRVCSHYKVVSPEITVTLFSSEGAFVGHEEDEERGDTYEEILHYNLDVMTGEETATVHRDAENRDGGGNPAEDEDGASTDQSTAQDGAPVDLPLDDPSNGNEDDHHDNEMEEVDQQENTTGHVDEAGRDTGDGTNDDLSDGANDEMSSASVAGIAAPNPPVAHINGDSTSIPIEEGVELLGWNAPTEESRTERHTRNVRRRTNRRNNQFASMTVIPRDAAILPAEQLGPRQKRLLRRLLGKPIENLFTPIVQEGALISEEILNDPFPWMRVDEELEDGMGVQCGICTSNFDAADILKCDNTGCVGRFCSGCFSRAAFQGTDSLLQKFTFRREVIDDNCSYSRNNFVQLAQKCPFCFTGRGVLRPDGSHVIGDKPVVGYHMCLPSVVITENDVGVLNQNHPTLVNAIYDTNLWNALCDLNHDRGKKQNIRDPSHTGASAKQKLLYYLCRTQAETGTVCYVCNNTRHPVLFYHHEPSTDGEECNFIICDECFTNYPRHGHETRSTGLLKCEACKGRFAFKPFHTLGLV